LSKRELASGLRTGGGVGSAGAVLVLIPLMLAACALPGQEPGSPQAQANAETAAACRQRADQEYNIRHRDTIYAPPSQVNTPFSADYAPGVDDRNLSELYEHDTMVSDCERNIGAEGNRTPEQAPSPPSPVAQP
jgi:hypothetical protein